jgi:hypothetical protein
MATGITYEHSQVHFVPEQEVRRAIQAELYLPALALALTIPDAYGSVEYSWVKCVGERYKKWYEEFCGFRTAPFSDSRKDGMLSFDANTCWKLRCEILHNGDANLGYDNLDGADEVVHNTGNSSFEIRIGLSSVSGKSWQDGNECDATFRVVIGLEQLCEELCTAADKYKRYKSGSPQDWKSEEISKVGMDADLYRIQS